MEHWRREDVRPVLPHCAWRRDLRRALDTADHPQPVPWLRELQRSRRARPDSRHPAIAEAKAARTARCRRVGTQARRTRAPYELTSAGHDLFQGLPVARRVGCALARNRPGNLDPFVALWSMCSALRRGGFRIDVVIRFDFTGRPRRERYWLLIERGDTEICKTYPGLDEDLYITAEAEAFVKWHAGQLTWAEATHGHRIRLDGSPPLVRAFPTWNARSMFAHQGGPRAQARAPRADMLNAGLARGRPEGDSEKLPHGHDHRPIMSAVTATIDTTEVAKAARHSLRRILRERSVAAACSTAVTTSFICAASCLICSHCLMRPPEARRFVH